MKENHKFTPEQELEIENFRLKAAVLSRYIKKHAPRGSLAGNDGRPDVIPYDGANCYLEDVVGDEWHIFDLEEVEELKYFKDKNGKCYFVIKSKY